MVRGTIPKVKITYLIDVCRHCDNAQCIQACKQNAIYKRDDGTVIIDPVKCTGRMDCIASCPYKGVIYFNENLNIAQKCTFCSHLLDRGWKEPRCVEVCPTGALKFGEEEELKELIAKAELLQTDLTAKPGVYYIGLPKSFITGAIYDPERDAVTIGAKVTLTNLGSGETLATQTDSFGDFWFKDLNSGTYSLKIEATGYLPKVINDINLQIDSNLGDIPLSN
jgi:Fe-S-cluster-containing dehydrogenase component